VDQKTRTLIETYIKNNIGTFHTNRIAKLKKLKLNEVLKSKNPYLFRAKNLLVASDLVAAVLDARLSSSEEGSFGGFLENLAIYVAQITGGGAKSAAKGIDIELVRGNVRYLVAVKSGNNWGNSGQHADLRDNFRNAVKVIQQSHLAGAVQPTLGICYGKFKTKNTGLYLHIGGQSFWELISGDKQLYLDIIEPLGHDAELLNRMFQEEKAKLYNLFTLEFMRTYCDRSGAIDWPKLVRFVSGNLP
jgi:hypothetical protein